MYIPKIMQPEKSYSRLDENYTFERFVVGPNSQFAYSAAVAVAESPGKTMFNPLLVYGGVGLGKTHLIQSIGNYVLSTVPGCNIIYMSSEEFHYGFIDSLEGRSARDFSSQIRESDVLLIDDVQFFAGKEGTQNAFFHIFNTLYQNKKQIVLASDRPPAALKGLEERLISRFQSGLSVDIQPPDLETRVAILNKKARDKNFSLGSDVLLYIAENVSNIREIDGALVKLMSNASINHCDDITLDLAKSVLKDNIKTEKIRISIDYIIEKTAAFYRIPVNNILEKNKRKEVAFCRQVAMYISKQMTNHTLKSIGQFFAGRDHSTVLHAVQLIEDLIKRDSQTAKEIETIISSLK